MEHRFSKRDTNVAKGVGIILMLCHHLFYCSTDLCTQYQVSNFVLSYAITEYIGNIGKVCVAIFVFLSGYGMTRVSEGEGKDRKAREKSVYRRYLKLEFNFFFVYLFVMATSFLGRDVSAIYGTDMKRWAYAMIDALGLAQLFGTPTLNATWWYMSLAVLAVFMLPIMMELYDKYKFGFCMLCIVLPYALGMSTNWFLRYVGTFAVGICFARENIFERLKNWQFQGRKTVTMYLKIWLCILGIAACCYVRNNVGLVSITEMLLAIFLIYFCYEFIADMKWIGSGLATVGKYSMNIFLIHTVIYAYYFTKPIYTLKYSVLILLATLLASLAVAVLMERMKQAIFK